MDRKEHWEQVYRDKSPLEVSWHQEAPTLSLELIHATGICKDAPIIDIGGGASVLVDRLCAEGFSRLAVLDISPAALAKARRRLGEHARTVEWFVTDVTAFSAPHPFAVWHDRATLHFLTDASDRRKYIEVLKRSLTVDGHVIIATFAVGGPTSCSGLDIVQYDAGRLCLELGDEFRLVDERSELHLTPAGGTQEFAYFRFIRAATAKRARRG